MTPREKLLALLAGLTAVAVGLLYAGSSLYRSYSARQREISRLQSELQKNQLEIQRGIRIADQLDQRAQYALPLARDLARSLYQNWLVALASDHQLKQPQISVATSVPRVGGVYEEHQFTLAGFADLEQLTRLLYDIQFAPILHAVRSLTIEPMRDQRELKFSITLAVVAMPNAPQRNQLPRGERIPDAPDLEEYLGPILSRNLFGPENQPPRLRVESRYVAYRGRPFELRPQAEDPDKIDSVRVEIDASKLPGARVGRSDGHLNWVPEALGEYTVVVRAVDNGFPTRESRQTVRIVVQDPPPPQPVAGPPAPSFNPARFAVVTGITSLNGQPQVWVSLRTEGRTVKVSPGEKFRVGPFEIELVSVDGKEVVFRSGDQTHVARLGESIMQ